jgi:hypothetical protein
LEPNISEYIASVYQVIKSLGGFNTGKKTGIGRDHVLAFPDGISDYNTYSIFASPVGRKCVKVR